VVFADSNVLLDILTDDPKWRPWSLASIEEARFRGQVRINDVVFAEISIGFLHIATVEAFLHDANIEIAPMPREALFLAGKAHRRYRAAEGTRTGVLPDFFIGAQAMVLGHPLLTRDARRYRTYFPRLELIAP
jgi:hypothetical protein